MKKKSGKTPAQCSVSLMQKNEKFFFTRFVLSLYSAQVSKKTIIPSIPMIHEGKIGKITKRKSNGDQKGKKIRSNFRRVPKFRTLQKFYVFLQKFDF